MSEYGRMMSSVLAIFVSEKNKLFESLLMGEEIIKMRKEFEEEKIDKSTSRMLTVLRVLIFSIVPIVLFYLMEAFEHNAFEEVRSLAQVYNIFLFELIAWILFFVTGNGCVALRIETVIAFVYGLVNHYVMAFRSTPLVPWDIFSVRTAASVAGNYDFTPTKELLLVSAGFVGIFLLIRFVKLKFPYGVFLRVIPTICIGLVLCSFVNLLWDEDFQTDSYLYPFLFTPAHMTKVNGMAVTFAMDMAFVYVEKPEGYSVQRAEAILAEYEDLEDLTENISVEDEPLTEDENQQGESASTDYPNIIVIMNEAFSDLAVLGEFETNVDYMPFVHGLQEGYLNTITGNLTVSVCGGNTANTEFEFLTGHTMDYFPVGSIPYQQYITGERPSLASHLSELGYATYGMHPYNASGWNRDEVYPWLGFEESYFLSDFTGRHYIRDYVSDQTAYQKIVDTYETKEAGKPAFIFEVTMQNHGGYTEEHENFVADVQAKGLNSVQLNQYLSLLKESDEQFAYLTEYFSRESEKTIIVFFGDHQPSDSVVRPILKSNGVSTSDTSVEQAQLRYIVPYVIWANYDIEEETGADTDISYLAANVMEKANLPMSAYQKFLLDMEANGVTEEYLEKYQMLQYYFMFDY